MCGHCGSQWICLQTPVHSVTSYERQKAWVTLSSPFRFKPQAKKQKRKEALPMVMLTEQKVRVTKDGREKDSHLWKACSGTDFGNLVFCVSMNLPKNYSGLHSRNVGALLHYLFGIACSDKLETDQSSAWREDSQRPLWSLQGCRSLAFRGVGDKSEALSFDAGGLREKFGEHSYHSYEEDHAGYATCPWLQSGIDDWEKSS